MSEPLQPPPPPPAPDPIQAGEKAADVLKTLAARQPSAPDPDQERAAQRRRENFRQADLPKRAVEWVRKCAAFAADDWKAKLDKVCGQLAGKGSIVAIHGLQSRGKTTMAVAAALRAIEAGRTVRYLKGDRMAELYDAARQPADDTELATEAAVTDWLTEPGLLILDEIGKMRASDYLARKFFLVLDQRYDALRDTLLVSNLEVVELNALLGNSVVERMHESGGLVSCPWGCFREKAQ